jgi:hypothetical protein
MGDGLPYGYVCRMPNHPAPNRSTDHRQTEVQGDRVGHTVVVDFRPIMATYLVFCSCVKLRGQSFGNDIICI